MSPRHVSIRHILLVCVLFALTMPVAALGKEAPIKETPSIQLGFDVNKAKDGQAGASQLEKNLCLIAGEECQGATADTAPGGFEYPEGVAASPVDGLVYVADRGNNRVQEFTSSGVFVRMIGWDVNKTRVNEAGATQQQKNICTASEVTGGAECGAGIRGVAGSVANEQFGNLGGIAIDPVSGDVYVVETVEGNATIGRRIRKLMPEGGFVWEIGRKVNKTGGGDLCSAAEEAKGIVCGAPEQQSFGEYDTQPLSFRFEADLASGGSEDLLYLGEEHRVKEFNPDGTLKREIPLTQVSSAPLANVTALAADPSGNVYLVYEPAQTTIYKFEADGIEVKDGTWPLRLIPRHSNSEVDFYGIKGLAADADGRLAVSQVEGILSEKGDALNVPFGSVLDGTSGQQISQFTNEYGSNSDREDGRTEPAHSMGFDASDHLYGIGAHGALFYTPFPVGELLIASHGCVEGAASESNVTFDCALNGSVDPWGVSETEAWFEWGTSSTLGNVTVPQQISSTKSEGEEEPPVALTATVSALAPDETIDYRVAAHDAHVKAPESLTSPGLASLSTPIVAPRVVGEPSVSFVHATSAVLFGEVNPENTSTEYEFEYAPCPSFTGCEAPVSRSAPLTSSAYEAVGTVSEATGLQPATTYRYRLAAVNAKGQAAVNESGGTELPEGSFTTLPAPLPTAVTGAASGIGTTSATISGEADPDGAAAVYVFELGVYRGASTQYGLVFSAPADSSATPVPESFALSGLQPGTTYAYRISIGSGFGHDTGETKLFTTLGLPAALVSPTPLAMLEVPHIAFPDEPANITQKALTRVQKLARALRACTKKPKRKRGACRLAAQKEYATKSKQKK